MYFVIIAAFNYCFLGAKQQRWPPVCCETLCSSLQGKQWEEPQLEGSQEPWTLGSSPTHLELRVRLGGVWTALHSDRVVQHQLAASCGEPTSWSRSVRNILSQLFRFFLVYSIFHFYWNLPPGESTAWGYLCDLLSALEHLHSCGFVHLDLKPANVLMTASGRLKLGDFGLLMELKCMIGDPAEEKVKDEMQEGDPRYMAPELLRGDYGPAADVFRCVRKCKHAVWCWRSKWLTNSFLCSLGVTILELACNIEVPNGGEGWQQLRQGCLPSEFTSSKIHLFFSLYNWFYVMFWVFFNLSFCLCRPVTGASVSATDDVEPWTIREADSFWAPQPPVCVEVQMEKTGLPYVCRGCTDTGIHLPGTRLQKPKVGQQFG